MSNCPLLLLVLALSLLLLPVSSQMHIGKAAKFGCHNKDSARTLVSAVIPFLKFTVPAARSPSRRAFVVQDIQVDSAVGPYLLLSGSQCEELGISSEGAHTMRRRGKNGTVDMHPDFTVAVPDLSVQSAGNRIEAGIRVVCDRQHVAGPRMGMGVLTKMCEFFVQGDDVFCGVMHNSGYNTRIAVTV